VEAESKPDATAAMTTAELIFPDVSSKQAGINLTGLPFVICKATQGVWYSNPGYEVFKADAAAKGVPFAAYHYLENASATGEAQWCYSHVGPNVPLMVDGELNPANGSGPDADYIAAFITAYRGLGGKLHLAYIPRWYWTEHLGGSLTGLASLGKDLWLAASDYEAVGTGKGWDGYGGLDVAIWQFTDGGNIGGVTCDMNAYRGTSAELYRLMATGNADDQPVPDMPGFSATPRLVVDAGWSAFPGVDHYVVKAVFVNGSELVARTTLTHLEGQVFPLASESIQVFAIDANGGSHLIGSRNI
jgi:GH25 family lysozyme M1 (1,4-beta-N-acetylmuramidase)